MTGLALCSTFTPTLLTPLKDANYENDQFVIYAGENELSKGEFKFRDMKESEVCMLGLHAYFGCS